MEGRNPNLFAWPESSQLLTVLRHSERPIYTKPSIKFTEYLPDKAASSIASLKNVQVERPVVESNISGLRTLLKYGHLRAGLNLSTKLLTEAGQGLGTSNNSIIIFEIWAIRFQIFMALKMYSALLDELAAFRELDAPDTYLQYYAEYAPHKGSIIPFSLRLVHAEAPAFGDEPCVAFVRVQRLAGNTKTALALASEPAHQDIWQKRLETVELMKARLFYKLKRYNNVFTIYESFAQQTKDDTRRREILMLLVRVALSVGSSTRLSRYSEGLANSNMIPEQRALYQCFSAIFYGNYELAKKYTHDSSIQQQQKKIGNVQSPSLKFKNNEAISLFYNGKMEDSLNILLQHEGALLEPIAANVGTIADLVTRSSDELLKKYFVNHCNGIFDLVDPETIKIHA